MTEYDEGLVGQIDGAQIAELCSKLIQFKTTNPPGDELALAEFVGAYMRDAGMQVDMLPMGPGRASVIGRLKGSGEVGPALFSGHLDTFPVTDQEWTHEPFGGEIAEGRVWGRGTTDMKGGDAAMLVVARLLAESQTPLRGDLILAFSADEETKQTGAHAIAGQLAGEEIQIALFPEPSENEVLIAEKGALWLEVTTHGVAGHIAQIEQTRNAILMMLPIIDAFSQMEIPSEVHPLLGGMARSVNMIEAGQKVNVVPDRCRATLELRTVPGQDHREIISQIEGMIREVNARSPIEGTRATVEMLHQFLPVETAPDHDAIGRLLGVVAGVTGAEPTVKGKKGGTDACVLAPALKMPFAICGPGSYAAVAAADEWVEIERLAETAMIYMGVAREFLG